MGQRELEQEEVRAWEAELRALHERIAGRFRRPVAHQRTLAYLQGLLGPVKRKNGWQLAEYAGDATPDGMQRLLATYPWDADEVRDDLREYVVEHLGDEQAVLVVDELGFLKQGKKSVGVQRQYSKTAGKVENCQIGLFLAYVSNRGQTLLDRELYLSDDWLVDSKRLDETGVPAERQRTVRRDKSELAQAMIGRALAAGVPFAWVAWDAVRCHGHHHWGGGWSKQALPMCWRWRATPRRCLPMGRKAWSRWRHGSWPSRYRMRTGSGSAPGRAASRGHASTIGHGYRCYTGRDRSGGIGCWCGAASPTPLT